MGHENSSKSRKSGSKGPRKNDNQMNTTVDSGFYNQRSDGRDPLQVYLGTDDRIERLYCGYLKEKRGQQRREPKL